MEGAKPLSTGNGDGKLGISAKDLLEKATTPSHPSTSTSKKYAKKLEKKKRKALGKPPGALPQV